MPIHINVMAIVPTVLLTMDTVMVAGIMDMATSTAVSVAAMVERLAAHTVINIWEVSYAL